MAWSTPDRILLGVVAVGFVACHAALCRPLPPTTVGVVGDGIRGYASRLGSDALVVSAFRWDGAETYVIVDFEHMFVTDTNGPVGQYGPLTLIDRFATDQHRGVDLDFAFKKAIQVGEHAYVHGGFEFVEGAVWVCDVRWLVPPRGADPWVHGTPLPLGFWVVHSDDWDRPDVDPPCPNRFEITP